MKYREHSHLSSYVIFLKITMNLDAAKAVLAGCYRIFRFGYTHRMAMTPPSTEKLIFTAFASMRINKET